MKTRLQTIEKRLAQYGADRCHHFTVGLFKRENGVEKLVERPAICPECGLPPGPALVYLPEKLSMEEWEQACSVTPTPQL